MPAFRGLELHDWENVEAQISSVVDECLDFSGDGELGRWVRLPACCLPEFSLKIGVRVARPRLLSFFYPCPCPLVNVTCIVTVIVTLPVTLFVTVIVTLPVT